MSDLPFFLRDNPFFILRIDPSVRPSVRLSCPVPSRFSVRSICHVVSRPSVLSFCSVPWCALLCLGLKVAKVRKDVDRAKADEETLLERLAEETKVTYHIYIYIV